MIYLIDCENVGEAGITGIEQLPKTDEVVLFYGRTQVSVSMDTHIALLTDKCKVSVINMPQSGRNYLDMQLAVHLGYLMKAQPKAEFTIISKDKGFDSAIDYLVMRDRKAQRVDSLSMVRQV